MIRPIFLFLLILLTTSGIYSENKQQTITVIGNGSAIVETDYVQINFSVEVENPDPKVAQEKTWKECLTLSRLFLKDSKFRIKIFTVPITLSKDNIYKKENKDLILRLLEFY